MKRVAGADFETNQAIRFKSSRKEERTRISATNLSGDITTAKSILETAVIREPYVRWCERAKVKKKSFVGIRRSKSLLYFALLDINIL